MSWRTFMIGWTMALVVMLAAHSRPPAGAANDAIGTAVVDFSYAKAPQARRSPAKTPQPAAGAQRVVAPLVVIDVTPQTRSNPGALVTMDDVAHWEDVHGHIPANAVVMARSAAPTRWPSRPRTVAAIAGNAENFPGFSESAIRFLVEARNVYGLGTETPGNGHSVVLVYRPPAH
jgi:hypothetical protein